MEEDIFSPGPSKRQALESDEGNPLATPSSNQRLLVSDSVAAAWKITFDSLAVCIKYPQLSENTLKLLLQSLNSYIKADNDMLFPIGSFADRREEVGPVYQCYADFHSCVSNVFVYLLTKDLGRRKSEEIWSLYQKLIEKLYWRSYTTLMHLQKKFTSCLQTILDSCVRTPMHSQPIVLEMFVVKSSKEMQVPPELLQPVTITSIVETSELVLFLTKVVFTSSVIFKDLTEDLTKSTLNVLCKRFAAIVEFGAEDINELCMLEHMNLRSNPKIIQVMDEIMTRILLKKDPYVKDGGWEEALEKQILSCLLDSDWSLDTLSQLQMIPHLKEAVLLGPFHDDLQDGRLVLRREALLKLMYTHPGLVRMSERDIKWLGQHFCLHLDKTPLALLMAYMDSELRHALPFLLIKEEALRGAGNAAPASTESQSTSNRAHPQTVIWHRAEDYSTVWVILKVLCLDILHRLGLCQRDNARDDRDMPSENPFLDLGKVQAMLQGLANVCCKLEQVQRDEPDQTLSVCFQFFQNEMQDVIEDVATLPSYCLPQKVTQDEAKKWQQFLMLLNSLRQLPETWQLEQDDLNLLEALSGLLWLKKQEKERPPLLGERLKSMLQFSDRLNARIGCWEDNPNGYNCDNVENNGLIVKAFFTEFHHIKRRASSWRAHVLERCLQVQSNSLKAISIHSVPLVITTCHRGDVPKLLKCLENLKDVREKSISLALAQTVPLIVCALSGRCDLIKVGNQVDFLSVDSPVRMKAVCHECDPQGKHLTRRGWNLLSSWDEFTSMWENLLYHEHVEVRKAMAQGMQRVCKHLGESLRPSDIKSWLKLLVDVDSSVGAQVAPHIPLLFTSHSRGEKSSAQLFEVVSVELKNAVYSCVERKSSKHWEAVIEAVFSTSNQPFSFVCPQMMNLVAIIIGLGDRDCCDVTPSMISQVAATHNVNSKTLFWQNSAALWRVIATVTEVTHPENRHTINLLKKIIKLFNLDELSLKKQLYRFLQELIPKCVKDSTLCSIIGEIAAYVKAPQQLMIRKWYPILYPAILLEQDTITADASIQLLGKLMGSADDTDIIKPLQTLIICKLVFDFDSQTNKVLNIVSEIFQKVNPKLHLPLDNSKMKSLLQPHLLGILVTFQDNILQKYVGDNVKLKALNSLAKLCTYMGTQYISSFHNKILDMISTFTNFTNPKLNKALCELVFAFVRCIEPKHLEPNVLIIVTNLMHLDWNLFYDQLKSILDYLIVEMREVTTPSMCELVNATEFMKHFGYTNLVKKCKAKVNSLSMREALRIKLKSISCRHEKSQVLGLIELSRYLISEQEKLQQILFGYDSENPTLQQIIGRLLEGSSSANPDIRRRSIECLSNLGAMDPNHWIAAYGFRHKSKFYIDAMCPTFVAAAFEMLVEEFQATSNNHEIDIIALVCQDLMRAHDFQDEPQKAPVEIWTKLSEQTQLLLTPFFKSNYASTVDVDESQLPHPIFGSDFGQTFQSWMFNWVCRLIGIVKNAKAKKAFTAMKWIFKINLKCTLFFLPHIFMYAAWSANLTETTKMVEEMTVAARLTRESLNTDNLTFKDAIFHSLNLSCSIHSYSSVENTSSHLLVRKTSQVIFFLMDFLLQWKLEFERFQQAAKQQQQAASRVTIDLTSDSASSASPSFKPSQFSAQEFRHQCVKDLLSRLSMTAAAESSHMCNENFRALRYLEMHMVRHKASLHDHLELFLRIYVQLQEEDGVEGVVSSIEGDTSEAEQLLVYEMSGQLQEAIIYYEGLIGDGKAAQPQVIHNMARAYLCLGEYQAVLALTQVHTNSSLNCGDKGLLLAIQLEALWRLGRWESLQQTLHEHQLTSRSTWASHFARLLSTLHAGNLILAKQAITTLRNELGEWLHKSSFNSGVYAHNYAAFLFMHIAVEIEAVMSLMEAHASSEAGLEGEAVWTERIQAALQLMEMRQRRVSSAWRSLEQLLSMRRTLLSLLQKALATSLPATAAFLHEEIGKLWLQSAKLALSRRQYPQVLHYALNAGRCNMKESFVVRAQLEWESGKRERALLYLRRGIRTHFPGESTYKDMPINELKEERLICAKARLLIADYSNEMKIVCPLNSVRLYKEALGVYQYWEESQVKLSRAWQILKKDNKSSDEKNLSMMHEEMKGYFKALCFGIKHLYESLPRIISIWANTGLTLFKTGQKGSKTSSSDRTMLGNYFKLFNDMINTLMSKVPMYAFYACFTHLASRLCHPFKPVYSNIQSIFLLLLKTYPHQMLWKLVPMLKVSHAVRVNRVQDVLIQYQRKHPEVASLVEDYLTLVDSLFNLGHAEPKTSKAWTSMKIIAPYLPKLFENHSFSKILMPSQDLIGVLLPSEDIEDYKTHNAFPRKPVYITGVKQPVQIISSLQRPKKFLLTGSDGNEYAWLVKTKDDLRIDGLVMEFMQVLNTLLQHDPACKERSLHCQTYTVVPLGEACGLIEWVPNLVPLRDTIYDVYKGMGQKHNMKNDIKKNQNPEVMRHTFEKQWLPCHPPVLGSWFVQQFPEDSAWHTARKQFVYSTAVMSMVGYILGLGDRHGGNIMLNVVTGQCVHVDFNCLFNKGETLPWPELVPFRLTHNIVMAMGGTGTEGAYRHTCELVLRLVRHNLETLLAVVKPIMYDASRKDRLDQVSEPTEEFLNLQLGLSINRIKYRMSGYLNDKDKALQGSAESALSPEGLAQAVIKKAMDIKNLSQMYPGWGAFL